MSLNLVFIKFRKRRRFSTDIIAVVFIMATIISPIFCFSKVNPKFVVHEHSVYLANLKNCKLLGQLDSIIEFAKDSLPNCNLDNLNWISITKIAEPRDTTYYINGKQYYDTEYFEAKGQDIINVFSGKSPSHDLRIVFGALILLCDNDKLLQLNGRFYKIDDYSFNILKTKYKFSRASIKEKVRSLVSLKKC